MRIGLVLVVLLTACVESGSTGSGVSEQARRAEEIARRQAEEMARAEAERSQAVEQERAARAAAEEEAERRARELAAVRAADVVQLEEVGGRPPPEPDRQAIGAPGHPDQDPLGIE